MDRFNTQFDAFGTRWWITLYGEYKKEPQRLFDIIAREVDVFENRYSRFRPDSRIAKLNKTKKFRFLDSQDYEVFKIGIQLQQRTDGIFSPLVGTYLEKAGYDSEQSFKTTLTNVESVELGEILAFDTNEIAISDHAYFDIGGYGKGLMVDKISSLCIEQGVQRYIINAGGDIFVYNFEETFYLEHPNAGGTYIGSITLSNGAIASSAHNRRSWSDEDGMTLSHILDPRRDLQSQKSELHAISTFTQSSSCLYADVAATVLLIEPTFPIQRIGSVEHCIVFSDYTFKKTTGYSGRLFDS